jgi:dihydrofolate synthase/folylpolyglutamate synthase
MLSLSSAPAIARLLALGGELAPPAPGTPRRKFDLAHMRTLLEALGSPHRRFPSVLIAGTNGKGSTAATLASILQAAGHRVGLYTSPHLEQPNERIRINGVPISNEALALHFTHVEAIAARLVAFQKLPHAPSFFETITAIAFLHFAAITPDLATALESLAPQAPIGSSKSGGVPSGPTTMTDTQPGTLALQANAATIFPEKVEIAILEVGLGGRLDATNVVRPLVSVLTDISLDHTEWLGSTIAEITREKAGILHPRSLLVTLPQHPEANQVIGEVAVPLEVEAVNAADYLPPRLADDSSSAVPSLASALRNRYSLTLPPNALGGATIQVDSPLSGAHQQRNIALAIATAIVLQRPENELGAFRPAGFALSPQAIEQGIRNTLWPGRLQLVEPPPASSDSPGDQHRQPPILLDAAHNPAGAWALRAALSPLPIQGHRTLIFGCMADKNLSELAQILFPVFDTVLLTQSGSPRAASIADLLVASQPTGSEARTFLRPALALATAFAETPSNGLIVIAGSIALLGELTPLLHQPL